MKISEDRLYFSKISLLFGRRLLSLQLKKFSQTSNIQNMKKIFIIMAVVFLSIPMCAQEVLTADTSKIEPIESTRLQGVRKATEAEKAYARRLAEEQAEQYQIDTNLPFVDENGQTVTNTDMIFPYWGWGPSRWRLHKGLNVNVGTSVFANFGDGYGHGVGFSEDVSVMYVSNLSKKATLAIGGYFNNITYGGSNYTSAGINALLGYRFNEHWSAYAFVQKAFTSDNITPWAMAYGTHGNGWGGYGMGYMPMYYGYSPYYGYAPYTAIGYEANRFMDRIGGGVTYQWGENNQNSLTIQMEIDHLPSQRNSIYNARRYDYPVR